MDIPEFSKQPQDRLPKLGEALRAIEFSRRGAHGPMGIKFAHEGTGQELVVAVIDKFPEMEDVHVEGRRIVEVSVEMFVSLVREFGYVQVPPGSPAVDQPLTIEGADDDHRV